MSSSMIFNSSFEIFFFVSWRNIVTNPFVSIVLLSWTLVFSSFVSPESFVDCFEIAVSLIGEQVTPAVVPVGITWPNNVKTCLASLLAFWKFWDL